MTYIPEIKDLKKAYRILRKEKNQYEKGDEKRIDLNKKMKEIKLKIQKATGGDVEENPEKQILIDKIKEFRTKSRMPIFDLNKFSISELEFHYMKITGKVNTKDEYNKLKGIEVVPAPVTTTNPFSTKNTEIITTSDDTTELAPHSPIEAGIRRVRRYK